MGITCLGAVKCKGEVKGKVHGKGEQVANTKVKDEDKTDDAGRRGAFQKCAFFICSLSSCLVHFFSLFQLSQVRPMW